MTAPTDRPQQITMLPSAGQPDIDAAEHIIALLRCVAAAAEAGANRSDGARVLNIDDARAERRQRQAKAADGY